MTFHQRRVDFSTLPAEASCCFSVATKNHAPPPKKTPPKPLWLRANAKRTAIQHTRDKPGRVVGLSLTDPQPWGRPERPAAPAPSATIPGSSYCSAGQSPRGLLFPSCALKGASLRQPCVLWLCPCAACALSFRDCLPAHSGLQLPTGCLLPTIPSASRELRNSSKPKQETASGTCSCFWPPLVSLRPVPCQWIPHHQVPWPTLEPRANNPGP